MLWFNILGAGALSILGFLILKRLLDPLRSVPGPWLTRWTDGWYLFKVWQGDFEHTNQRLHEKYGPVVRYGPKRYSVNHPTAIDIIYGFGTQLPKSDWYSTWTSPIPLYGAAPPVGTFAIFADQYIKRHAHNRKLFQSTYSLTSLKSYEPYVDDCADLLSKRFHEIAAAGVAIDLRHWLQCYAFDVIGLITYAKRFGFLDQGEDVGGVIRALEDHLAYATLTGIYPSWHRALYALKNFMAKGKGSGRAYIINFTLQCIAEHRAEAKAINIDGNDEKASMATTESFLSKFIAKHAQDPEQFTRAHIVAGCVSNMVAGSDTTALSLSAVFYYLLKNPACLKTLKEEISSFTAAGKLSDYPTFAESQDMPYFQAVIKETFRVHPAGGLPLERVVPSGGVTIDEVFFPEQTVVGINAWVEHNNKFIFGDDVDEFKPERWLTADTEKLRLMNHHSMAFGLGSRTCIGRHISMLEMCKLIPRIVRDFDLQLAGRLRDENESWGKINYWFVKPVDFMVTVANN